MSDNNSHVDFVAAYESFEAVKGKRLVRFWRYCPTCQVSHEVARDEEVCPECESWFEVDEIEPGPKLTLIRCRTFSTSAPTGQLRLVTESTPKKSRRKVANP